MPKNKAGDFQRLSAKRLPKVLEAIRIYGHLANRGAYFWTDEELVEQLGQIDKAVAELHEKFGVTEYEPGPALGALMEGIAGDPTAVPPVGFVELDPDFSLNAWKEDRVTDLSYPEWVAEKHAIEAVVPDFIKKDWKK